MFLRSSRKLNSCTATFTQYTSVQGLNDDVINKVPRCAGDVTPARTLHLEATFETSTYLELYGNRVHALSQYSALRTGYQLTSPRQTSQHRAAASNFQKQLLRCTVANPSSQALQWQRCFNQRTRLPHDRQVRHPVCPDSLVRLTCLTGRYPIGCSCACTPELRHILCKYGWMS